MIDIHCHIIPGVDDGPANYSQFVALVNMAVLEGITHLYATPHHMNGKYNNTKQTILERVQYCNKLIESEGISLMIHPGQEVRIHRGIFDSIAKDEILTLDNKEKYLLLELPFYEVPHYTEQVIYELTIKGIIPVIVHPERNQGIQAEPNILFNLIKGGALVQLTAGSITGAFGKRVKSLSERLIEHRMIHFIASDAHNCHSRAILLKQAYEEIEKRFGMKSSLYYKQNTEMLLAGNAIEAKETQPMRRKLFGLLRS